MSPVLKERKWRLACYAQKVNRFMQKQILAKKHRKKLISSEFSMEMVFIDFITLPLVSAICYQLIHHLICLKSLGSFGPVKNNFRGWCSAVLV